MNHLLHINNRYHFRYVLPPDVRPHFNRRVVSKSLKTSSLPVAEQAASVLSKELRALVTVLRQEQGTINMQLMGYISGNVHTTTATGHKISIDNLVIDSGNHEQDVLAFNKILAEASATNSAPSAPAVPSTSLAVPLSKIISEYASEKKLVGSWKSKTEGENVAIYDQLVEILGDIPCTSLTAALARDYKDALKKLPTNRSKMPAYRGKSAQELVVMNIPANQLLSVPTINKNLNRVASLMGFAVKNGYIAQNFFNGLTIPKGKNRDKDKRSVFTGADVRSLFVNDEYSKNLRTRGEEKYPYMYWVPLIGLYSSKRLEEICQLSLTDIRKEEDILVFSVNEDAEKHIKTQAGLRMVPVHPVLIAKGLLTYVTYLKSQKHTRLFPELALMGEQYSSRVSKFFTRYKKRCGITDKKKVFHSFRHTVIDTLQKQGVSKSHISAIVGHADEADGVTLGTYGKGYAIKQLASFINMISYGCEAEIPVFNQRIYCVS